MRGGPCNKHAVLLKEALAMPARARRCLRISPRFGMLNQTAVPDERVRLVRNEG